MKTFTLSNLYLSPSPKKRIAKTQETGRLQNLRFSIYHEVPSNLLGILKKTIVENGGEFIIFEKVNEIKENSFLLSNKKVTVGKLSSKNFHHTDLVFALVITLDFN
jgi:hypothetical protein